MASGLPQVFADGHQVQQVLLNLVINAEQAMLSAHGRGVLVIRSWQTAEPESVVVEINDDGPGIPEGSREAVFTRFTRLDASRSRDTGGSGLGLAIVRALAMHPELLLLDEITSALDPELVGEVLDLVRDLRGRGMTMLIATHEMAFAREISDRVCFLHAGRILEQGPPEQLFTSPREDRTRAFLQRVIDLGERGTSSGE